MNPYGQPVPTAPPAKKFPTWAIVLIVLGAGLCVIVPVLATLAIYGTRKYITNAKTAEARNALGQMAKDAVSAYERGQLSASGTTVRRLCRSASRPVPASISSVSAMKYQSAAAEWEVDKAANAGFACLEFSMDMPQYYQYSYTAHGASAPGDGFTVTARGDLNGDGVESEFSIAGQIDATGNLVVAPNILEKNPSE